MSINNYDLLTFHDAIDAVRDAVVGGDASARNLRQAQRAILEAYQELPTVRDWRYYYRRLKITTVAPYSTGTIEYDHTGGASERLLTLTSGTFPADAEKYEIQIENVRYEIDRRISDTTLQLSERANPGADIAAGESYTLLRDTYELPDDFLAMWDLIDVLAPGRMQMLPWPSDTMLQSRIQKATALPSFYTVARTTKFAGGYGVVFSPAPSSARTYDAIIKVRPLVLKVLDDNEGTASIPDASATVTGVSSNFISGRHVGAVIRFSPNATNPPTSLAGQIDQSNLRNPFTIQRVIKRVDSTTSLEVEQASDYGDDIVAVKYRISSRIDIEPGAMLTYFFRLAESKFGVADRKGVAERVQLAKMAFQEAAWADQRMREDPGAPFMPHSLADIANTVSPTTLA